MMTVVEILTKARSLIETKGHTKGAYARDANGVKLEWNHPHATCYCLMGAVNCVADNILRRDTAHSTTRRAIHARSGLWQTPDEYNDLKETTKQDVLDVLDAAIELAKAEAS